MANGRLQPQLTRFGEQARIAELGFNGDFEHSHEANKKLFIFACSVTTPGIPEATLKCEMTKLTSTCNKSTKSSI